MSAFAAPAGFCHGLKAQSEVAHQTQPVVVVVVGRTQVAAAGDVIVATADDSTGDGESGTGKGTCHLEEGTHQRAKQMKSHLQKVQKMLN